MPRHMANIQTALPKTILASLQAIPQASPVLKKVSGLSLDYIMYLCVTYTVCPSVDNILMNGQTWSDPVLLLIFKKTYRKRVRQSYSDNLLSNLHIYVKRERDMFSNIYFFKFSRIMNKDFFFSFPRILNRTLKTLEICTTPCGFPYLDPFHKLHLHYF